jgi:3-deoxy-D-manno-octulosonic-acid transferase
VRVLYNILFQVLFLLAGPYYSLRMRRGSKRYEGFNQRFAEYDRNLEQSLTNRHVIWLHVRTVNELDGGVELVRGITQRLPNAKLVVSTSTIEGMNELRKRFGPQVAKIYFPLDHPNYVVWALETMHPDAIVLLGTELWPNFIWQARKAGVPLFLVSGQLSERAWLRFRRFGALFRPLFGSFYAVAAPSEEMAGRLRALGCRPGSIQVVGQTGLATEPAESAAAATRLVEMIAKPLASRGMYLAPQLP